MPQPPLSDLPSSSTEPPVFTDEPGDDALASRWKHPAVWLATLSLALLAWQWVDTRDRHLALQEELARRLAAADVAATDARAQSKHNEESLRVAQERIGAVDARLDQMQGQQGALDALYQELARTRDDRLLAEVEQAINIANQQLQLAGNVESALLALQEADVQLARANRAHFLPLRKALNRDIDSLKAVPVVDISGLTLKLEGLLVAADTLPLAFERKPAPLPKTAVGEERGVVATVLAEIWNEIRQMVRIERLDRADPGLLAPTQVVFLRENLKLRLLDARLALLSRQSRVFDEDIRQARAWIEKYFDLTHSTTQSAQETLAQLAGVKLATKLPVLTESLAALKMVKIIPERVAATAKPGGR